MKKILFIHIICLAFLAFVSCGNEKSKQATDILFLHHSTGAAIWKGNTNTFPSQLFGKLSNRIASLFDRKAQLPLLFEKYNKKNKKNYSIRERTFPKNSPYGWNNFPYDYYNIWVKNAGDEPFMEEPTLEMLTKEFQVIIFKHCFPVCNIQADLDTAHINSDLRTLPNYKLQYSALKEKLHEFPNTKFILFTGATLTKSTMTEEEALRTNEFFGWVTDEWDTPGDNIYLWDLYRLQTEGGLYFKDEYAVSSSDPHPNVGFADKAGKLLFNRIIDIIERNGIGTQLTGEVK